MPLTEHQATQLHDLASAHLEDGERVVAVADASLLYRGWHHVLVIGFVLGAFVGWTLVGQLVGVSVVIRLFSFPVVVTLLLVPISVAIAPRWKLVVTNRRFLALRKHRLKPRHLIGTASSYRRDDLDRIEFAGKPMGGVLTLVGSATGGKEVSYALGGCKPSSREFEGALGSANTNQASEEERNTPGGPASPKRW